MASSKSSNDSSSSSSARACGSFRHLVADCPDSWENMASVNVVGDDVHPLFKWLAGARYCDVQFVNVFVLCLLLLNFSRNQRWCCVWKNRKAEKNSCHSFVDKIEHRSDDARLQFNYNLIKIS